MGNVKSIDHKITCVVRIFVKEQTTGAWKAWYEGGDGYAVEISAPTEAAAIAKAKTLINEEGC